MDKKKEFQKLEKKIKNCQKCVLSKTRKNVVFGEGLISAKIMVVGQAPGANEDETGRPFIGRSGQVLTDMLEIAKIDRKKIFITSIGKCFPPQNRKPSKDEIKNCLPYLEKQIEIIKPKKIILLGGVAFKQFFPKEELKDCRGKIIKKDGMDFFPTYHPAAALRFPIKIRGILEKDFKKLGGTKKI